MVNEWTRADLMPRREIVSLSRETHERGLSTKAFADAVLDAVVEHLNANNKLPTCGETIDALNRNRDALVGNRDQSISSLQRLLATAEADRDRWRRARNTTRRERDEWEDKYLNTDEELHRTRLERDEWKARAEAAEQYAQAVSDSNRDNADRASRAECGRDAARREGQAEALRQAAYVAGDVAPDGMGGNDWFPSEWSDYVAAWLECRADQIERGTR